MAAPGVPLNAAEVEAFETILKQQGGQVCGDRFLHWRVYVDRKQYHIGRCFAWLKRPSGVSFYDLTEDEYLEFRDVADAYKRALEGSNDDDKNSLPVFGRAPDLINISFLGNESTHCHAHFVPRYLEPPVPRFKDGRAQERDWTDAVWGGNYSNAKITQGRGSLALDTSADDKVLYLAIVAAVAGEFARLDNDRTE